MRIVALTIFFAWTGLISADPITPGDPRSGYESTAYNTASRKITQPTESGRTTDLYLTLSNPPLGLPPLILDRQPTRASINLGRKLFFDRRLSFNDTLSCAMCHIPEQGFGQYELATPVGIEGRAGKRNSPPLYNVGYRKHLFTDGREDNLEQQIWGPLLAHNEMGNPSIAIVLNKLRAIEEYPPAFMEAFQQEININTLGMALADYQRALLSGNSPFDRWYYDGESSAVSDSVKRGFDIFIVSDCAACHQFSNNHALFTDNEFHDIGVGFRASMKNPGPLTMQLAPGVFVKTDALPQPQFNDLGRYEATGLSRDKWKYSTPGLRNISVTRPYMHDGSMATLEEVIDFYDKGGEAHAEQDQRIRKLHLSEQQKLDLLAFLESLTSSNIDVLARDARTTRIGER